MAKMWAKNKKKYEQKCGQKIKKKYTNLLFKVVFFLKKPG